MNNTLAPKPCPKCGGPIPAEASQGVCPKCLLAAVATPTETGQPAASRPPPPSVEAVQAALPHLEILELIGWGGMGAVYRARQAKLDRVVALKLLMPPLATEAAFAERFNREARVLARLNHPGVVSVFDYGEAGGFFHLVMEFVDGVNLRQAMQAGRFTPAQALALVPKICEALQYAHDEGILHRDIKPENILLDTRGRVKIADFGIAKLVGGKAPDAALTASGIAVGTPHYMAPEQLERPQDVDLRADIYSLGVVFYEMLTGELPIGRFAPPSRKSPVDPRVDEVVLRALEKERERRQPNATEVRKEIEHITATPNQPPPASRPGPAATPPVGTPKTALCYLSTPERMRNCFPAPQAHIFQCRGELRLEADELNFTTPWQTHVTIPLKEICDLSIGQFQMWTTPWVMKYERINFLSVTFTEAGRSRTVHLTPVDSHGLRTQGGGTALNPWFEAIRKACVACTGQAPRSSDPASLTISAEPVWNRKGWPLFFASIAGLGGTWFAVARRAAMPLAAVLGILSMWLIVATFWFAHGFLKANAALRRGDFDAVTSDEPPGAGSPPEGALPDLPAFHSLSAWLFILIGAAAAMDTLISLFERPFSGTLYPGVAHLLAGVALLTLKRGWRNAALIALGLALGGSGLILTMSVVRAEKALVGSGRLGDLLIAAESPQLAALTTGLLAALLLWPAWLLLSRRSRALFGLAGKS